MSQESQSNSTTDTTNTTDDAVNDAVNLAEENTQATESEQPQELSEVEQLKAKIAELEAQAKEAKEAQARINAEAYNAQRRMEQEAEKSKKFALQKFAKELLDVVDNLERAIVSVQNDSDADDAIMEGVKLTHKSLLATLNKNGVEVVDPMGEKFNPDYHEAVGITAEAEHDHVGVVLQKGYTLNGRSIRPAMVQVGA